MSKRHEVIEIRPHHGLCAEFFVGKGYSEDFAENMAEVLKMLGENNSRIAPKADTDLICAHCPNNADGVCNTYEKVLRYDKKTLELCGLTEGMAIQWEDYRKLLREKIIGAGKLGEVCGDCQWFGICGGNVSVDTMY